MKRNGLSRQQHAIGLLVLLAFASLTGCSGLGSYPPAPATAQTADQLYKVGPLDTLNIVVWRNPDLSGTVAVRPDGRISSPLVQDLVVAGRTPIEIGKEIETILSKFVREPNVTVLVTTFQGTFASRFGSSVRRRGPSPSRTVRT